MKIVPKLIPANTRSAFTLVELMVSCAIIGVMMAVLLASASTSLGLWKGTEQRIAVDREGRNGLAIIADDLANVLVLSNSALQPKFRLGNAATANWAGDVFMEFPLLRPKDYQDSAAGNEGDICFVRYRCVPQTGDKKTFVISRSHVDSLSSFSSLKSGTLPAAGNYEIVATNVTRLTLNAYDAAGAAIPLSSLPPPGSTVNLSMAVVGKKEAENLNAGIPMPDAKSTIQNFSINTFLPTAP